MKCTAVATPLPPTNSTLTAISIRHAQQNTIIGYSYSALSTKTYSYFILCLFCYHIRAEKSSVEQSSVDQCVSQLYQLSFDIP